MTERRTADFASLPEGEALSAYLSGDLDPAAQEALEARLGEDPALAAHLERMRELLESLRALDNVPTPDGYAERLRSRLAQARAEGPGAQMAAAPDAVAVQAGTAGGPGVRSISSAPSRRRAPWAAIGAVAAALLAVVVVPQALMRTGALDTAGMDAVEAPAGDAPADEDAMPFLESAPDSDEEPAEEADAPAEADGHAPAARPQQPVLTDEGAVIDDEAGLRTRFSGLPETSQLLGTPLDEGRDLAAAYQAFTYQSDALLSGAHPGDCLDPLVAETANPVVVARVEALTYADAPALAYVLVGASAEAGHLDRVELWAVEPDSCRTLTFLDLTP